MIRQDAINAAKYEAENPRLELLEICHQLRSAGAVSDAETLEAIVARIEEWQNQE